MSREAGMGMAGKTGDYGSSSSNAGGNGGGRQDTESQYGGDYSYDSSQNVSDRGTGFTYGVGDPTVPEVYNYPDRIQRIADGVEPGYRATDDKPFGLDPEQAYMQGKISKDQLETTLTRTQEVPDQRTLFQKTIDLYQKYSPFGLLSNLFANAPDYVSPPATTGGENEFRTQMNQLAPYAPYAITDTTPQESVANQYFQSLGMSNQPLSSNLQTDYNNAKTTINSLLGTIPSPNQQFGYGILNNQGFNNQAYADYLRRIGLL